MKTRAEGYVRSTVSLAAGTAVAQLVAILTLPVITRLYAPSDFGVLGVYVAVLTILTAIACLRLEIAIPLPADDNDGINLLALALGFALLTSMLSALVVALWPDDVLRLSGSIEFADYSWLLPMGLLLAASSSALQFWKIRKERFATVASTRVVQAAAGSGTQLMIGVTNPSPFGLIIGNILMSGGGAITLAYQVWRHDRELLKRISFGRMLNQLRTHRKFPQYSSLEALANSAGSQLPLVIMAATSTAAEVGFVLLALRVCGAPMQLIGTAIGQVFMSRAPAARRDGRFAALARRLLIVLALVGIPMIGLISLAAPYLFSFAFGNAWQRAGEIVQWMTLWFMLQFLTYPISTTLHLLGRNLLALGLQLFGCAIRIIAVLFAVEAQKEAEAFALSGAVFYLIYLLVLLWAIGREDGYHRNRARSVQDQQSAEHIV